MNIDFRSTDPECARRMASECHAQLTRRGVGATLVPPTWLRIRIDGQELPDLVIPVGDETRECFSETGAVMRNLELRGIVPLATASADEKIVTDRLIDLGYL
jgi:hypothetical protein